MKRERSPAKFLLVDDLEENLLVLEATLRRPGLDLVLARSGREALELLLVHEFALAIIDVQMPEMDGFELAELMRGAERTRSIPIIFLTAGIRDGKNLFAGYQAGAVDFLFKPFDTDILKHKTHTFLELYEQRRELAETLRLNEELVAIVSHDLRTPLSAILMAADIVRSSAQEPAALKAAERIESSGRRMTRIIQDLLDLSRARLGSGIPIQRATVDLVALAKKAVAEVRATAPHCEIEMKSDTHLEGSWDGPRLEQVLTNLLANAVRHGNGSVVEVTVARCSPEDAAISVHNAGVIKPEARASLFEAFQQRPDRDKREGLGLGLYIVDQIVHAHGGKVSVESSAQGGTTFQVTLPTSPPAAPA